MPEVAALQPSAPVFVAADSGRYDVFLSYARADWAFVETLTRDLEARGKDVWVDRDDIPPGAEWRRHVARGIEASKVVVFVLSPESVRSEVCAEELAHAVLTNKRIVPVVRRAVDPSALPEQLTAPNWIWLREEDDAAAGRHALVHALELDEEWLDAHVRLTVRAREWEQAARDRSFLLRGSDLDAAEAWLARQGEHSESATQIQVRYILDSRQAASRRRRATSGAVLAALAIAVALAVVALVQRHEAVRQSQTSQSRELAAAANAQLGADPQLSLLLATEAARIAPTTQATAALRAALETSHLEGEARLPVVALGPPAPSPNRRYVLQGGLDGAARVVDMRHGSVAALLRPAGPTQPPSGDYAGAPDFGAAFSPDSRHVATVGFDETARVWDWRARRVVAELPGAGKARVAFSPDGRTLAVGAVLWDWRRGRVRALRAGYFNDALVAFAPSGRYVATAPTFGDGFVWDVRTGHAVATLPKPPRDDGTTSIAFSHDARRIVRGTTDGIAELWDWRRERRVAKLQAGGRSAQTTFGQGDTVIVGTTDGTIRVWDPTRGDVVRELRGHRGAVTGVAVVSDRAHPSDPSRGQVLSSSSDRTIRRWSIGQARATFPPTAERQVTSADLSADGRVAVTGGATYPDADGDGDPRRVAEVFDARSHRRLASLAEQPVALDVADPWLRVELSPDGRFVSGASDSGIVHVWDWRRSREVAALPHASAVGDATFSPDGKLLATTTERGVHIWSWRELHEVRRLAPPPARPDVPGHVDFAPDGAAIAVTEGNLVRIYDWRRKQVLARLALPAGAVDVSFDGSGRLVAIAGDDGVARVFDWRSGESLAELRGSEALMSASFSADGALLLTGTLDAATVWDWRLNQRVLELRDPRSASGASYSMGVGGAAFGPGAARILTAGPGKPMRLYDCGACGPDGELLDLARVRTKRKLSAEERLRYLHDGAR